MPKNRAKTKLPNNDQHDRVTNGKSKAKKKEIQKVVTSNVLFAL